MASEAEDEDVEAAEVKTTSSLNPSSGDTKTISQPAALAARALSLTPLMVELPDADGLPPTEAIEGPRTEDRVEVFGGGAGGCFFTRTSEAAVGFSNELCPLAEVTEAKRGTGLFLRT